MFSRQPAPATKLATADIKSIDQFKTVPSSDSTDARNLPPPVMPGGPRAMPTAMSGTGPGSLSIIGNDLTIVGQGLRIITQGALQVDGKIEGDVVGNEVIIGEKGQVTGVVSAENIIVRGQVNGTIRGLTVSLQAGARVEGDVHHQRLSVEQGAHLDGRVRRPADIAELRPNLSPGTGPTT